MKNTEFKKLLNKHFKENLERVNTYQVLSFQGDKLVVSIHSETNKPIVNFVEEDLQLKYVDNYFIPYHKRIKTQGDIPAFKIFNDYFIIDSYSNFNSYIYSITFKRLQED